MTCYGFMPNIACGFSPERLPTGANVSWYATNLGINKTFLNILILGPIISSCRSAEKTYYH